MDNLTRNQIIRYYLKQYLSALEKKKDCKSDFAYNFFTKEELHDMRTHFKYSSDTALSDYDVLSYLIYHWEHQQYVSEHPDEAYLNKIVYQLGLHGHYLDTKFINQWDNYDYSNFDMMKIKSGRSAYAYAIFTSDVNARDINGVNSLPFRWFSTLELAEAKKKELMAKRGFSEGELKIHQDLRPL